MSASKPGKDSRSSQHRRVESQTEPDIVFRDFVRALERLAPPQRKSTRRTAGAPRRK